MNIYFYWNCEKFLKTPWVAGILLEAHCWFWVLFHCWSGENFLKMIVPAGWYFSRSILLQMSVYFWLKYCVLFLSQNPMDQDMVFAATITPQVTVGKKINVLTFTLSQECKEVILQISPFSPLSYFILKAICMVSYMWTNIFYQW